MIAQPNQSSMSHELLEKYIQTGNDTALSDLMHSNPELAIVKTSHHISPLMLSCYYKKPEILLEAGSDLKARTDDGKTPADMATEQGFGDIARILAE